MVWVIGIGFGLFLLFAFPRQMGVLLMGLVAVGVGIFIYVQGKAESAARERSNIAATAFVDEEVCSDPAYPMAISFRNGANRTLSYIGFSLLAHEPGFSGSRYTSYLTTDRIIPPGQTHLACWSVQSNRLGGHSIAGLDWSVRVTSARFQ